MATATLTLVTDTREERLSQALAKFGVAHTVAPLDVGDFMIQNAEGEPLLVAERKSLSDFAASNADGRYREQRARLMAVRGSGVAVLYILEGTWSENDNKVFGTRTTQEQLKRLTSRLTIRYGMPILFADTLFDTARWCRILLAQLTADPTVFQPEDGMAAAATTAAMAGFTASLNTVKKGNKTPAGTALAMLSAIPGLGEKRVAGLLAEKSIVELCAMTAAEIAEIKAGGKKLGTVGETIWSALHAQASTS